MPSASEGLSRLYGLVTLPSKEVGREFSSAGSVVGATGRFEVKGMRKGGMVGEGLFGVSCIFYGGKRHAGVEL